MGIQKLIQALEAVKPPFSPFPLISAFIQKIKSCLVCGRRLIEEGAGENLCPCRSMNSFACAKTGLLGSLDNARHCFIFLAPQSYHIYYNYLSALEVYGPKPLKQQFVDFFHLLCSCTFLSVESLLKQLFLLLHHNEVMQGNVGAVFDCSSLSLKFLQN